MVGFLVQAAESICLFSSLQEGYLAGWESWLVILPLFITVCITFVPLCVLRKGLES